MRVDSYMENRAHGESKENRLKRFLENPPTEAVMTLLNSIDNYFNNEIEITSKSKPPQTSLLFMGIHASALTIAEALFDKTGLDGYKSFLREFIDGDKADLRFSDIASDLHNWRNVLAHQWLGSVGHRIGYDYTMDLGWRKDGEVTFINPRIYCEQYLNAFSAGGKIWRFEEAMTGAEFEQARGRIVEKYLKR